MRQFLYPSLTFDFQPGDFNRDGSVDAADYLVWRQGLGAVFGEADINIWRSHFGQHVGTASNLRTAIPEPAPWKLVLASLLCMILTQKSQTRYA
jgi:hypothetical protein